MDFDAPWALSVKVISVVFSALLVAIALAIRLPDGSPSLVRTLVGFGPLALVAGCALFTVRGYRLEAGRLSIRRLLWSTTLDLSGLRGARHDPEAMKGSLRLFGNGGLFSISGVFRNRALGNYRAWATDPKNAVVLELEGRTVVVTPGEPEGFLRQVELLQGRPA